MKESYKELTLALEFGSAFCYTPTFEVNGVEAEWEDFGEKYDRSPETAEDYGCGDMQFTMSPPTKEVLDKYQIDEEQYEEIARKLEDGLSFGNCGWCV